VLGGRYAVQRRLEQMPRAERWSAHDLTLERDVVVVCFSENEPHADSTLDAARRAAGLDNHRLVRVLDVGRSEDIAFFVEEAIHDAHTLTHVLEQGGLPAEESRRIAGEVATALEAARSRGLHHLQLNPSAVLRGADGSVKLRGVATAAAMAGIEDVDSTTASRLDAVGVVAIAYAALTSRWPLPDHVVGLESAPHVVGGVPAPSEIAAGVPGDLDALCRLTLNEDQGPLSPGDFASQIAPWSATQVSGLGSPMVTDEELARTVAIPVTDLPRGITLPVAHARTPGGEVHGEPAAVEQPATVPVPHLPATTKLPGTGTSRTAGSPGAAAGADEPTTPLRFDPRTGPAGIPSTEATQTTAPLEGAGDDGSATGGQVGAGAAAAAGAVGVALGTAGHAAGQAAGAAAHRVGTFARAAADKAAERRALKQAAQERAEQRRISLDEALLEGDETLDPPLPMLRQETAAAPTRDQSKLVLAIIAGFVAVATILGFWGASRIGSGSSLDLGGGTPHTTVTVTAPPATVTPSGGASTTAEAGGDFPILGATGFDPEGDNAERNGEAPRVFDGKTSTFWSSEGYASADLGGLKKGVGVRLDLGQVRKVSQVTLVLPDPADVTVYVGQDRTLDNTTALGSSKDRSGTFTITAQKPVDAQYVFVWFTKVSKVSDGRYRATLAEVSVR
jgi:hypothetical protein